MDKQFSKEHPPGYLPHKPTTSSTTNFYVYPHLRASLRNKRGIASAPSLITIATPTIAGGSGGSVSLDDWEAGFEILDRKVRCLPAVKTLQPEKKRQTVSFVGVSPIVKGKVERKAEKCAGEACSARKTALLDQFSATMGGVVCCGGKSCLTPPVATKLVTQPVEGPVRVTPQTTAAATPKPATASIHKPKPANSHVLVTRRVTHPFVNSHNTTTPQNTPAVIPQTHATGPDPVIITAAINITPNATSKPAAATAPTLTNVTVRKPEPINSPVPPPNTPAAIAMAPAATKGNARNGDFEAEKEDRELHPKPTGVSVANLSQKLTFLEKLQMFFLTLNEDFADPPEQQILRKGEYPFTFQVHPESISRPRVFRFSSTGEIMFCGWELEAKDTPRGSWRVIESGEPI